MPDLPRRALQREDARDQVPRPEHRRRARHDRRRGARVLRRRAARAPFARACCAKSASATCGSASPRPSSPAAKRSASSSPPSSSARSAATRSTSSTSRRPACIPPTSSRLVAQLDGLVDAGNTVIVVEHDMRVVAQERLGHRHRPGRGRRRRARRRVGTAGGSREIGRAAARRRTSRTPSEALHRRPPPLEGFLPDFWSNSAGLTSQTSHFERFASPKRSA